MAKKTIPTALQTDVTNDDEWAQILTKKGLLGKYYYLNKKKSLVLLLLFSFTVVDIYAAWSGPCTGMVSTLKKLKMEIGGDALSYATARCDNITDLQRFKEKSEPIWMFIRDGMMINLMFGAHCPQLVKMLTTEFQRIQNGDEPEFCISVNECSPEENTRMRIAEEARILKEAEKKAQKEAETKAKYEAEMNHLINSLIDETCLLLYPWIFKDEEGHKRDKKCSPPYVELVEEILPGNYIIEQEIRKRLNEDILDKMFHESDYVLTDRARQLILDGKCMLMRLRRNESTNEMDVHQHLITLLFGEPVLPSTDQCFTDEIYCGRHRPGVISPEMENDPFPIVWTPPNARNKATVFRLIFSKYTDTTYPYEDKSKNEPIIIFKYDSTRKNELKMVLEMYNDEVVDFGVFECDKLSNIKMIAKSIEDFESNIEEKTGYILKNLMLYTQNYKTTKRFHIFPYSYEVFICTVKKIGREAFLAFAGIGPFYVSDNHESANEESKLYFPNVSALEEIQSDDEDKLEEVIDDAVTTENIN
ncbi:PREDICTED: uncharacterized protein LOC107064284 isoform X3 [Polistes dominula]|nr:PREDICTED: uncharacterized protein LOC107064284 isoform X3 [Polistes dominula]XP_015172261.1 PREDICTED: uncharacterized protein LOC107064284 isoform X3 [Polistes dominula]